MGAEYRVGQPCTRQLILVGREPKQDDRRCIEKNG
jgi:hypothetical protein